MLCAKGQLRDFVSDEVINKLGERSEKEGGRTNERNVPLITKPIPENKALVQWEQEVDEMENKDQEVTVENPVM